MRVEPSAQNEASTRSSRSSKPNGSLDETLRHRGIAKTFRTAELKNEQKAHEDASSHMGLNSYFGSRSAAKKNAENAVAGTVHVGFRLHKLRQIDHETESFEASFKLFFDWCDPNLARTLEVAGQEGAERNERTKNEWQARIPEVQLVNAIPDSVQKGEWIRPPKVISDDIATGRMYIYRTYTATFVERQELHEFPFDVQELKIMLKLRQLLGEVLC